MIRVSLAVCLALLLCPSAAAKNYALLIGISEYDYTAVRSGVIPLQYADDDALILEELLRNQYTVRTLVNKEANREGILTAFAWLRDIVERNDTFLLFFAGHGLRDPGNKKTYWLTYDTKLDLLDGRGIRLEHLFDYVRDVKAERKVVLLDHCFSGDVIYPGVTGVSDGERGGSASEPSIDQRGAFVEEQFRGQLTTRASGLVILAAARNAAMESESLGHGLFTEALRRSFGTRQAEGDRGNGRLSLSEMTAFVTREVDRLAEKQRFQQKAVTFKTDVVDEQDWEILDLPPEGSEAEVRRAQYLDVLKEWRQRKLLKRLETFVKCQKALDLWVEHIKRQTDGEDQRSALEALGAEQWEIVEHIREAVELAEKNENDVKYIAQVLEETIVGSSP